MNLETSQPSSLVSSNKESSTSHPVMGESLPSSFPYVLISPVDTKPTMLSSLSTTMSTFVAPPFIHSIISPSGPSTPSTSEASTNPSSSSLSGFGTTFHFGMGSSSILGSRASSTITATTSTTPLILKTFLYGVHLFSIMFPLVPSLEQAHHVQDKPLGLFLEASFFPIPITLFFHTIQM